jgi:SET domain-containing protein
MVQPVSLLNAGQFRDDRVPELPIKLYDIRMTSNKGRGVFALYTIKPGQVIEESPVLVIPPIYYDIVKGFPFISHTFVWRDNQCNKSHKSGAIAFGVVSLCNHAQKANARVVKNFKLKNIYLRAIRPIQPGEEITICYKNVWFPNAEAKAA